MRNVDHVGTMSKNVIIFSDDTGQAGGIKFDETRINIYKRLDGAMAKSLEQTTHELGVIANELSFNVR